MSAAFREREWAREKTLMHQMEGMSQNSTPLSLYGTVGGFNSLLQEMWHTAFLLKNIHPWEYISPTTQWIQNEPPQILRATLTAKWVIFPQNGSSYLCLMQNNGLVISPHLTKFKKDFIQVFKRGGILQACAKMAVKRSKPEERRNMRRLNTPNGRLTSFYLLTLIANATRVARNLYGGCFKFL